jgi:hypothetical protein
MTTIYKSVHIEGKWPYKYEAPNRRTHTEDAKKRQNELRRARYAKAKAIKTPKGKKLIGLRVYEMNDDICQSLNAERLNDAPTKSSF